ncbi:MAG TPA: glycosyltransferase family 4 protein, partial [Acidimicrobiia bacterium]|nr:glycosyltransferase family 4 protein [Acidimicrobiia bacterium]
KADPWPVPGDGGRGPVRPILFVGRHEPRKGLDVLLDAFGRLDPGARAVLWVAGEGPGTDALRALAPPGVEWLGRISDGELARRLKAAAVFCAPSLHGESFGVVLLEAMAAGTPIVASVIAGYRDVARHRREALLVEPGDPAALRDALIRALDDGPLAAELVEAGVARAARFSMERLAERYLPLYESVLQRSSTSR